MKTLVPLFLTLQLFAWAAIAGEPKEPPRQPVEFFALTEERFAKYSKALENLEPVAAELAKAAREEEKRRQEKKEKTDDSSPDAIIGLIADLCDRIGVFRKAVRDAGLACREYALIDVTLMQASVLSVGYEQRGEEFLKSFPGGTGGEVKANLAFVIARKEAIGALIERQRKVFAGK